VRGAPCGTASSSDRTRRGARYTQTARSLGVPDFHPHRLRLTLGTLVQEQLGDARRTAETLGRADLGSVAGYTKITESRRQAVKNTIDSAGL
jgi:site-specific recombinase XerC